MSFWVDEPIRLHVVTFLMSRDWSLVVFHNPDPEWTHIFKVKTILFFCKYIATAQPISPSLYEPKIRPKSNWNNLKPSYFTYVWYVYIFLLSPSLSPLILTCKKTPQIALKNMNPFYFIYLCIHIVHFFRLCLSVGMGKKFGSILGLGR